MKDTMLAWIAGIMDADGFFTIKRNTYSMRIRKDSSNPSYQERVGIKQVQPEAIKIIHKYFGGYYRIEKPSAKNGKPLHCVGLSCKKAVVFIEAIFPYLIIKRKQAKILLLLRKYIDEGRKGYSKKTNRSCISNAQIRQRENLIKRLNQINDIRSIKEVWRK